MGKVQEKSFSCRKDNEIILIRQVEEKSLSCRKDKIKELIRQERHNKRAY